jgi:hypothetical protein
MMYFKLITLTFALVALGRAASVPTLTAEVVTVEDTSYLSHAIPGHAPTIASDGKIPARKGLSVGTSPHSAFHALISNAGSTVIFCPGQGCSGSCYYYSPTSFYPYTCYAMPGFMSTMIYSSSGSGVPYGLNVGIGDCYNTVGIPYVNQCYNLYSGGYPAYYNTAVIAT